MSWIEYQSNAFGGGKRNLANDTAISFPGPENGMIFVSCQLGGEFAIVDFDARSTGARTTGLNVGADVNLTTGALTGTTGLSGKINISCDTNQTIYIENRRGSSRNVRWMVMGLK